MVAFTLVLCALLTFLVALTFLVLTSHNKIVSIRTKLYALAGFTTKELERNRWQFESKEEGIQSNTLLIAFGGGAMALMLIPRAEFMKTFSSFECDKLFLTDPNQSWYLNDSHHKWRGIEEMNEKLENVCSQYQHVICVGNCMGASAALLFSHHFTYTIAFEPQIHFLAEKRFKFKWGSKRLPKELRQTFHILVSESIKNSSGPVHVHVSSQRIHDVEQVSFLPILPNLTIHYNNSADKIVGHYKKRDLLVPLIKKAFQEQRN